jgi:hypothetical protein
MFIIIALICFAVAAIIGTALAVIAFLLLLVGRL